MYASPSRPSVSGRNPCGSRTAISRSFVSSTSENAPCACETDSISACFRRRRLRSRVEVQQHFGVARRLENRALRDQHVAQLLRVDQVAVVPDGDLAVRAVDQDRLRVLEPALAGRGVAHVADGARAGQPRRTSPR